MGIHKINTVSPPTDSQSVSGTPTTGHFRSGKWSTCVSVTCYDFGYNHMRTEIINSVILLEHYFGLLVFHISTDNFIKQKTLQSK